MNQAHSLIAGTGQSPATGQNKQMVMMTAPAGGTKPRASTWSVQTDRYGLVCSSGEPFTGGNSIIRQMIDMENKDADIDGHTHIHDSVINEYEAVHRALIAAKDNIRYLINARHDGNPETWKWLSPIVTCAPENTMDFTVYDTHNSWVTYAYKGRGAITLMTPMEFMTKAEPLRINDIGDIRGDAYSRKTMNHLKSVMNAGGCIDAPYLNIDDNGNTQYEGMHRAHSAILSGIDIIPVYLYKQGKPWNEIEIKEISKHTKEVVLT